MTTRHRTGGHARRAMALRATVVLLAMFATTLLTLGGGRSMSAFTGSITNKANTVRGNLWSCQDADLADRPTRLYSLANSSGGTNLGSAGAGTDATLEGSGILIPGFATGGGCKRDTQRYYTTTSGILLGIAARWVSTAGRMTVSAGSVFTQEVWFRTSGSTGGGLLMGFGSSQRGQSAGTALQVFLTDDGRIDFATGTGSSAEEVTTPGTKNYADQAWHHVVAVYDGGASVTKKLYVDGLLRASGSGVSQELSTAYWRLGYGKVSGWLAKSSSSYLEGGVQWAAVYPTALSAVSVGAHYTAGVG